jgi:hypothetical protein
MQNFKNTVGDHECQAFKDSSTAVEPLDGDYNLKRHRGAGIF